MTAIGRAIRHTHTYNQMSTYIVYIHTYVSCTYGFWFFDDEYIVRSIPTAMYVICVRLYVTGHVMSCVECTIGHLPWLT
jgi:hypothetical protein